jgi:N-acetylglucosaminyldiphosphoundecaprenol N-acetyl-beta-D-mannosaminyltransferase
MMDSGMLSRFGSRRVCGVRFDFPEIVAVAALIDRWRHGRRHGYITLVNPHSVMMCRRDGQLDAAIARADLVLPDGIGIVLACRLLGYGQKRRVTGPSLMLHLCDAGRSFGFRHYFYGGMPGVAGRLAERLTRRFPGLQIVGTHSPPFRELTATEDADDLARINKARADVVWIGMGAPKQEKWMAAHRGSIHAPALVGVGAAFDFHSGNVPWAPRWVRAVGCEWAYRLMREPRRMWRRNLDSPLFLATVLRQSAIHFCTDLAGRIGSGFDSLSDAIDRDPPQGGAGASVKSRPITPANAG